MLSNCDAGEDSLEFLEEIKPVNPEEANPKYPLEGNDAEAETPVLWPPDVKSQLIWKDPDAEKDWRWKERAQQRMRLNGHEFG